MEQRRRRDKVTERPEATDASPWYRVYVTSLLLFLLYSPDGVFACGGLKATIAAEPRLFAVKTESGPRGTTLHFDNAGNVYVAAEEIRISSALAEAIAKRYLQKKYERYEHLEFEAFTYDHGDLVYMYHAHVPDLAYSVHVGPLKSVSDHAHVHVSALTGDVYGPGCGFGSGAVEMKFDAKEYPADLRDKRLPYLQFNTSFIAREGKPPKIDGRIEKEEWRGAGREVIHVGTPKDKVTEYG
ncbi:MAG TPA: hypothetical protein VNL14_23345 [Candidatus Acidoferrales bacterium]|nr:hypothetical protein [Candidatus Acidoferrales bacterium]